MQAFSDEYVSLGMHWVMGEKGLEFFIPADIKRV